MAYRWGWACIALFLAAASLPSQDLPVTRVVLFTSGVGYFEHSGTVTGNVTLPFSFQESQVNDILKSLVLRDPSGSVGTVNYPSQDAGNHALKSFAIDLSSPGGIAALLPQLRGVDMTLSTPADVTGKLVGTDIRRVTDHDETILTLASSDGLRTIPLASVSGIKLTDPGLNAELTKALALLAGQHDTDKKVVSVRFSGAGNRPVSVGYISEAPVWKTSYRLDLTGAKPFLQAWAIVENTSQTDWNNVRLSLVSGRPISFLQDLYTPLHVERPVYVPETEAGPAPQIHQSGMPAPAPMMAAPSAAPEAKSMSRMSLADELDVPSAEPSMDLRSSGVSSASVGAKAGELFEFNLSAAVSLPRQQSALIPLSSGDITAEKISLYNADTDSRYPMNAVWVTNTTGLRLPAGPVTVFDGGSYAGDSLTDSLLENDKRLWTYATDLSMTVDSSAFSKSDTTKISALKGVITFRNELTWTQKYNLDNKAAAKKTVLIEQPYHAERTLAVPAKYEEKTESLYRFRVDAAPKTITVFEVTEKQIVTETQAIAGWSRDSFLALVQRGGPVSAALRDALQKAADLRGKVDQLNQDVSLLVQQKSDEENGQARIRANITAAGKDSAQGQSYLKRLADSDQRIDQLAAQLADKRQAQATAQKDLDAWLRNLTAE